MPPRLQCLNAVKAARSSEICSRASFSTTATAPAAFRSGSDALAALGDEPPSSYRRVQLPNRNNSERQPFARRAINNPGNENANRAVLGLIGRAHNARNSPMEKPLSTAEQLERHKLGTDLSKQINRRWKAGDVYAPHDLSPIEMAKWKKRGNPTVDVFDVLDLNPIDEYKNFSIMSEYMTPMGRIKHSNETGLRPVNQRRIARAIRRSIGMGLMPSVHRHPEILQKETTRRNDQLSRLTKAI